MREYHAGWAVGLVSTVLFLAFGCGDDGGTNPPAPPRIGTGGGDGGAGNGGVGANVLVECYGTGGITVATTGTVDCSFTVPADPALDFGTVLFTCGSDMTVPVYAGTAAAIIDAGLADGMPFMVGAGPLYVRDTSESPSFWIATGLDVSAGCTMTLGLNQNAGVPAGLDTASLSFLNDVRIAGTLKTAALSTGVPTPPTDQDVRLSSTSSLDAGALSLNVSTGALIVAPTGSIDTSGLDSATTDRAGCGGYVSLIAPYVAIRGPVNASGGSNTSTGDGGGAAMTSSPSTPSIIVQSTTGDIVIDCDLLDCSGGDGATAGNAGQIWLSSSGSIYSTARLVAAGGSGTTSGNGSAISFSAQADLCVSGMLDSRSGTGAGGKSGNVSLSIEAAGQLICSGGIHAEDRSGDGAGAVNLQGYGGDIRLAGGVWANGCADPSGASASAGGSLTVTAAAGTGSEAPGSVYITGDIDLSGGSADTGAAGGFLGVTAADATVSTNYGISFVGYPRIVTDGGDGAVGGKAGDVMFTTGAGAGSVSGPISVEASVSLVGGNSDGVASTGGQGGVYSLITEAAQGDSTSTVTQTGDVTMSGGSGVSVGGVCNIAQVLAYAGITWQADLTANGGAVTGAGNCAGGPGGQFLVTSDTGDVALEGACTMVGMPSTGTSSGGAGGQVAVEATLLTVTAAMAFELHGGDADTGTGGNGGTVEFTSGTTPTAHAGSGFDLYGGPSLTGTAGGDGTLTVDGVGVAW